MNHWLGIIVGLAACGSVPHKTTPLALSHGAPIDIHATALVEQGDAIYVLAGNVATIVRGGIVTTRVEAPRPWIGGTTIAAPDGDGRWVIAVDDQGVPWRLTLSGEREPVADQLGLAGAHVRSIVGVGSTFAADLGDAIAFTTDGLHLTRVPVDEDLRFAVARGTLARAVKATAAMPAHVERWDLVQGTRVTYPLSPSALGFLDGETDHPRLVAVTDDRIYVESAGKLAPFAAPGTGRDVAARGDRLWIGGAGELWLFDHGKLVPTQHDDHQVTLLAASTTGDAWLSTEHGIVRYSVGGGGGDPAWQTQVAPVFQRVCAHCHLPGGEAGIDLSTAATWQTDRAEIGRRVLETRTMPPAGTELTDADRAALAGWLAAPHAP